MKNESNTFEEFLAAVSVLIPRMTRSVESILRILSTSTGPMTAVGIMQKLKSRKVSVNKVTIYRKLALLKNLGVIREVLLSGEKRYYELTQEHHHHLVCLSCECVTDWVPDESLLKKEESRLERQGFQVQYHSLE